MIFNKKRAEKLLIKKRDKENIKSLLSMIESAAGRGEGDLTVLRNSLSPADRAYLSKIGYGLFFGKDSCVILWGNK